VSIHVFELANQLWPQHNVECRTMPNRLLPLLSFSAFSVISVRYNQTAYTATESCPFAHVSNLCDISE